MKTFKQFLVEQDTSVENLNDFVRGVIKDCQPYLQHQTYYKTPLYRGIKTTKPMLIKTRRESRKPLTTVEGLHTLANQWFKDRFGYPFRDGIFATGQTANARTYGPLYQIFPAGNFAHVWSPELRDFLVLENRMAKAITKHHPNYDDHRAVLQDLEINPDPSQLPQEAIDAVFDLLDQAGYQNTDLPGAVQAEGGKEIMIMCDRYYAMSEKFAKRHQVPELIKQRMRQYK